MTQTDSSPIKIDFSSLHMPYTAQLNAHDPEAWDESVDWVRRFSLLSDRHMAIFPTLDYHVLSSYAFPDADAKQLSVVNDCMTVFYLFDKVWDEYAEQKEKKRSFPRMFLELWTMQLVMRVALSRTTFRTFFNVCVPHGGDWAGCFVLYLLDRKILKLRPKRDRFMRALIDLRERMFSGATAGWRSHFRRSIRNYFNACFTEAVTKRLKKPVSSVRTYMSERQKTGGVQPSFELAGVLGLTRMPAELLDSPSIAELSTRANNVITLFNDLISLEKEIRVGDTYNMVLIIQNTQQCSLENAIQQTVRMHNDEVAGFERRRSELEMSMKQARQGQGEVAEWAHHAAYKANKADLFNEVEKYVQTLCAWMFSNKVWSEMSERYRSPAAPAAPAALAGPVAPAA